MVELYLVVTDTGYLETDHGAPVYFPSKHDANRVAKDCLSKSRVVSVSERQAELDGD